MSIELNQTPLMPLETIPIVSIGTGGIVANAHYPAYRKVGFQIHSAFDIDESTAQVRCQEWGVPHVDNLTALIEQAPSRCVFDIAVPGSAVANILRQLPIGSYALIQKPLGETLAQAREIVSICESREIHAATNFQLRWAPYMLALQDALEQGLLGETYELEVKVNTFTPWANWTFLEKAPRMEMVYHSIHYLDFIRLLWGEPLAVKAHSINDPSSLKLESTRSTVVLDYGKQRRAVVQTFHNHMAPARHGESYCRIEGTRGAMWVQMGLNLNYPKGDRDALEIWRSGDPDWTVIEPAGSWFPDAFIGPMAAMMRWENGLESPSTEVHDSFRTMALVEAAYASSAALGIAPDTLW